ncbi:hypothetical protein BaRGS_00005103 [Batillaria attramentaria]|uniref:Uncharacterized protein n=1 Tax=Batillaria attramentaria TaxID=370345 RepID=A0ABD0LVD8_9CAEN
MIGNGHSHSTSDSNGQLQALPGAELVYCCCTQITPLPNKSLTAFTQHFRLKRTASGASWCRIGLLLLHTDHSPPQQESDCI